MIPVSSFQVTGRFCFASMSRGEGFGDTALISPPSRRRVLIPSRKLQAGRAQQNDGTAGPQHRGRFGETSPNGRCTRPGRGSEHVTPRPQQSSCHAAYSTKPR